MTCILRFFVCLFCVILFNYLFIVILFSLGFISGLRQIQQNTNFALYGTETIMLTHMKFVGAP